MAGTWFLPLLLAALVLNCHCQEKKVHIVYMGDLPKSGISTAKLHHTMLKEVLGSTACAKESLLYSYGRSFNGFVAKLSDDEVAKFQERDEVVSVIPNKIYTLHTTKSWDFMGFPQDHLVSKYESDVIVGLLDTGIWPEAASFSDKGFGPPPARWKGICQTANITCNNKIIGARYYNSFNKYDVSDFKSPRDAEGHGTHTASTAAGRAIGGVSFYGLGEGIARGAVPQARIAMYKVCWVNFGCYSSDILAAFDDAIADGVDIISVSLGSDFPVDYFQEVNAIGSFHAMKKGVLTSSSAGNSGPFPYTVSNFAPWSLTVAANSIDRKFVSKVVLGNGQTFIGNSINAFELNGTTFPLIYGGAAPNVSYGITKDQSRVCDLGYLNSHKTKGKIVICDAISDCTEVMWVHALGTIMSDSDPLYAEFAYSYPLPATLLSVEDGAKAVKYFQSTDDPIGTILASETWNDVAAPRVGSFSSRGPNPITLDILKPDLTAPGVDIIAAWSPVASPSVNSDDTRRVKYNIVSGTSMSCPHASGAAAYVKSFYPSWSPAAIKSALMTTASVMDSRKNEDAEFAYGSGQINPTAAIHPGLVFDADEKDYVNFLCKQGYSTTLLRLVTGDSSNCSGISPGPVWDLNYPSFALSIRDGQPISGIFHRTVTYVGRSSNSSFHADVYMPTPVKVIVEPSALSFSSTGEKKSFTVKVTGPVIAQQPIISGYISWKDGIHTVRCPLVVYTSVISASSVSLPNFNKGSSFKGSLMNRIIAN